MKTILLLIVLFCSTVALAQELDRSAVATAEVTRYVDSYTKNFPSKKRAKIFGWIPLIVTHSLSNDLDPLWVCEIMDKEASFDERAIGARGEVGVMQTHDAANLAAFKLGYKLNTIEGQIAAGTMHLKFWIEKCGDGEPREMHTPTARVWTGYASGNCDLKWSKLAYRMREYQKAVEKFRYTLSPTTNVPAKSE